MTSSKIVELGSCCIDLETSLGGGAYGDVYFGVDSSNGEPVAAKKIPVRKKASALKEIEALEQVPSHPYVVKLRDSRLGTLQEEACWLVLDYCDMGDLEVYCNQHNPGVYCRVEIMTQIAGAVKFMHDNRIIHRDIKPKNIFMHFGDNDRPVVKMGDFGVAKVQSEMSTVLATTDMTGSLMYMAPEVMEKKDRCRYGVEVDIFSTGLVFWALMDTPPDDKYMQIKIHDNPELQQQLRLLSLGQLLAFWETGGGNKPVGDITKGKESEPKEYQKVRGIIREMLRYKPADRYVAEEVETHMASVLRTQTFKGIEKPPPKPKVEIPASLKECLKKRPKKEAQDSAGMGYNFIHQLLEQLQDEKKGAGEKEQQVASVFDGMYRMNTELLKESKTAVDTDSGYSAKRATESGSFDVNDIVLLPADEDEDEARHRQKGHGGWTKSRVLTLGLHGVVRSVHESGDVAVETFLGTLDWHPGLLRPIDLFEAQEELESGDAVLIEHDEVKVKRLQDDSCGWIFAMRKSLGEIGVIRKVKQDHVQIEVCGTRHLFHPDVLQVLTKSSHVFAAYVQQHELRL